MFNLKPDFQPTQDQQNAVDKLSDGITSGHDRQVLLGVTGSGKTFTAANVIQKLQQPALILSHNKTLAGQLYQEMRNFFPDNAVSYFVSYYDYYQPEAYMPSTDTYIEKEAQINDMIDKLRLAATSNILTRDDVIVVASVSCIYNIGSPTEYAKFIMPFHVGQKIDQKSIFSRLIELQYERSEFDFHRGTFRVRGGHLDIYPAYDDFAYRLEISNDILTSITTRDPLTGKITSEENIDSIVLYPAKHYLIEQDALKNAEQRIRDDLAKESAALRARGKNFEAERLIQKVSYDLEMMLEMGYVNGIENYSRYFDGRKPGGTPFSLLEFFNQRFGNNWLTFIDESHMTLPQVRGMYNGDQARKQTLIDYGFRLQAALDNRPLRFEEFYARIPQCIYISATPNDWEIQDSKNRIIEQLVRPTGIIDPHIDIRPTEGDIQDLIKEIKKKVQKKERVLVTTLTKRTAEDLSDFLKEEKINAVYLHSDIKTLERTDILQKLRKHEYDVLVGVNLLREGLDLPEVTLVAVLDADKEGFLRSRTSLIQTMGRAARNVSGEVILYADKITRSMQEAIDEVERRRAYQIEYNTLHNITPRTIHKKIQEEITKGGYVDKSSRDKDIIETLDGIDERSMTPMDKTKMVKHLEREMRKYADQMDFEAAILIRDKIRDIKG